VEAEDISEDEKQAEAEVVVVLTLGPAPSRICSATRFAAYEIIRREDSENETVTGKKTMTSGQAL
jgi:hypothetical protein